MTTARRPPFTARALSFALVIAVLVEFGPSALAGELPIARRAARGTTDALRCLRGLLTSR